MKIFLVSTAMMVASLWIPAASQSGCTAALINLSSCLSYISGSSSTPSSSCCTQLANIVKSNPQCLCMVLNGGGSIAGIAINQTQALALPGACNVQTPPASECKSGGSSGSPVESPSGTPTTPGTPPTPATPATPATPSNTPGAPSSPSGTASPTDSPSSNGSQSSNGDSSDGKMNKSIMSLAFSALFIFGLSLASFF